MRNLIKKLSTVALDLVIVSSFYSCSNEEDTSEMNVYNLVAADSDLSSLKAAIDKVILP